MLIMMGKYFIAKYELEGTLFDVNTAICFKFKLKLKFRNNKKLILHN